MLKIVVKQQKKLSRTYQSNGETKTRYYQEAGIEKRGFQELIVIQLRQDEDPYKAGEYTVDPSSYRAGRYGDLEINPFELRLIPYPAAA